MFTQYNQLENHHLGLSSIRKDTLEIESVIGPKLRKAGLGAWCN